MITPEDVESAYKELGEYHQSLTPSGEIRGVKVLKDGTAIKTAWYRLEATLVYSAEVHKRPYETVHFAVTPHGLRYFSEGICLVHLHDVLNPEPRHTFKIAYAIDGEPIDGTNLTNYQNAARPLVTWLKQMDQKDGYVLFPPVGVRNKLDMYAINREAERQRFYRMSFGGLPPVLRPEDRGELICTIIYNHEEGTVRYENPDGTPYGDSVTEPSEPGE